MTIRRACLGAAFAALLATGCAPPAHAAVAQCSGTNFADYDVEKASASTPRARWLG